MVKSRNKKFAYTLLEATVVMLILSIFIAVTANVIPHKIKPKNQSDAHGRFECYYNGNKLYQRTCLKGDCKDNPDEVTTCRFVPPKYIKYLIVNAVGASAPAGGSAGEFLSTFYSSSNSIYDIEPGKFGSEEIDGTSTRVYKCDDTNCTSKSLIMKAVQGINTSGADGYKNTTTDDIQSCVIEKGPTISYNSLLSKGYMCSKGPICEIETGKLKVSYCRTNELYRTVYLPYKKQDVTNSSDYKITQFIIDSPYTEWDNSTNTITYYDTSLWDDYGTSIKAGWNPKTDILTPSLYKLTITLKLGNVTEKSLMDNYMEMLQLPNGGIRDAHPGSIISNTPKSGAVLILW